MTLPVLSLLLLLPGVGAILTLLAGTTARRARAIAVLFAALTFLLSGVLLADFVSDRVDLGLATDPTGAYEAYEEYTWFQIFRFAVTFNLGVDGLSMPLVFLTTLLLLAAVLWPMEEAYKPKGYYATLQVIGLALIGVFVSLNVLPFFVFWEVVLIPMFFLINIWGGPNKHYSAMKFLIYTAVGSVIMLLGLLALAFHAQSLDFREITAVTPGLSVALQIPIFLALLLGFGIKLPMVPFHTWLPDAHVEAPTAGSVILAGVLLKMGGYGLFRLGYAMLPGAALSLWWLVAILGIFSMLYASVLCLVQVDLKRLIAYSSVGHMGFVLLGASAAPVLIGISGAIFQLFNHGLITAVLFMLAGAVQHCTGSREIPRLRGLGSRMPIFGALVGVSFLASLGLPGLNSFISEFMVFVGAYAFLGRLLIIPLTAVAVTAAYYLWTLHRILLGDFNQDLGEVRDLHAEEWFPMALVTFFILLVSIWPALWVGQIDLFSSGLAEILATAGGG